MQVAKDLSLEELRRENELLYREVQVARKGAEITAKLVVQQFVKMEEILQQLEEKIASEHRLNQYMAALHETALGLIKRLDLNELLQTLINRAIQLMDTKHGFLFLTKNFGEHHQGNQQQIECRLGTGFFCQIAWLEH